MLTLALDTTTRAGSVAVVRDAAVLAVVHGDGARTHGERLPGEIERALQDARVRASELELLVVASGPGAFTGLRIGLAATQGLAMVLGRPVIAVSALDALASFVDAAGPTGARIPIAAWMDAARGEVFAAFYAPGRGAAGQQSAARGPVPTAVPTVGAPDTLLATLPADVDITFVGDGAVRYRPQILHAEGAAGRRVVEPPAALAPYLAWIGIARAAQGEAGPPHGLQPLYVRRPDAELERLRREGR